MGKGMKWMGREIEVTGAEGRGRVVV